MIEPSASTAKLTSRTTPMPSKAEPGSIAAQAVAKRASASK